MSNPGRRQFIRYTSGGIAGAALLAGGWWKWTSMQQPMMHASGLGADADQLLAALGGAGVLGEWIIVEHPDYDQPIVDLTQQLRSRLQLPADGPVPAAQFSEQLQQSIQQDFAAAALLAVQNWQLTRTEALVAVLRFKTAGVSAGAIAQAPIEQQIVKIANWGPRTTTAGTLPNSFGEGFSALWFDADNAPRWAQIEINNRRLFTTYRENRVLVASFQGQREFQQQLFSQPGEYPITLHDDMSNSWQHVGNFVVTEAAANELETTVAAENPAFCKVKNWGSRQTTAGVAKHPQKDGSMGVWIDIDCAPADTRLSVNEQSFKTHSSNGVITSNIPPEMFQQPGELSLSLVSESAGTQLEIGVLVIQPN